MTTAEATFHVFRGEAPDSENGSDGDLGEFKEYKVPVEEGMVVLDAIHYIQGAEAPDLAVRWNCKAAKCGSCSAEINGKPRLLCKQRMDALPLDEPIVVSPIKAFPLIKDLVTDVSWNYKMNAAIPPFQPKEEDTDQWEVFENDVVRTQEFRKCIECFLCQDVCHVLRNHDRKDAFAGPRFMVRLASLDMHPMDARNDRVKYIKEEAGIGLCNITKCCTEVCPEDIKITDNAIIPMKERVVDEFYDPIMKLLRGIGLAHKK